MTSGYQQVQTEPNNQSTKKFITFPKEVEQSIPERFLQQVKSQGDRLAIKTDRYQLTYHQLNQLSNRIARGILAQSKPEPEPIALLLASDAPLIAAMLGVLKTGKFYVPLDPAQPQSRIGYILADSQSRLIITNKQYLNLANQLVFDGVSILNLDELDSNLSSEELNLSLSPDSLAYIIYTSGSTGKPKGVMQAHNYVLHLTKSYTNSGKITKQDRLALLYSPSFAGAVRDIYCALLNGASLHFFDVQQLGLNHLAAWLRDAEITVFFAVATMFRHFAMTLRGDEQFPNLRLIFLGSETVYERDVQLYQKYFSDRCQLIVNLGGTEVSPIRQFKVDRDTQIATSNVPAGYAVEDHEILLLDEEGREVGVGEVGEIVVRSRYLAVGYWQQPELTAAVFSVDSQNRQQRCYKTGDLGRFLPDGCLLHLGRKDFQVKIRGYRVELSEIEMALCRLPGIKEAVVTTQGDSLGEPILVAYIVPSESNLTLDTQQLREVLKEQLPAYMLPTAFVSLSELPLTATGKIDRRSLPAPTEVNSQVFKDYLAPRTCTEKKIAEIYAEVLKINQIGVNDNFFELGGHSLLALQAIVRINKVFGINLYVKDFFTLATVEKLAKYIESQESQGFSVTENIHKIARTENLPLSFDQQRLWFIDQLEGANSIYNITRAFKLQGQLNIKVLEQAIQTIINRQESLRTSFKTVNGSPVEHIVDEICFSLPVIDLQSFPKATRLAEAEKQLTQEWRKTFDLTQSPLFRAVVLTIEPDSHLLMFSLHHIIGDDWSVQVFLRELSTLYDAHLNKIPASLPSLSIQYADYAHWQRQYLQGEVLNNLLDYWRQQLADAPEILELPCTRAGTINQPFVSQKIPFHLGEDLTQKLKQLSLQKGTTLFVTILTAFYTLLYRYTDRQDLVVGTGLSNRNFLETESLIGFFVNLLPLRCQLTPEQTFQELLLKVHQTALEGYAHGQLPFDLLVENLQPQRHPGYTPLFQILFLWQNVTKEVLHLPGLTTEPWELDKPTAGATFDLTFSVQETNAELQGYWEYNTNILDADIVEGLTEHFQTLLNAIVADSQQSICKYPLLTAAQKHQLLEEWNQTDRIFDNKLCVHQWFETQVEQTPDAVAVVYAEQTLTYRELNQKANQLAHHLQSLGVKPDQLVGICVQRSLEMAIGMLAILKAGGAYLPLDPSYPQERLAYMLEDAGVSVLLTQSKLTANLPAQGTKEVCFDQDWQLISNYSSDNPKTEVIPTNLAYVIYTSGSTGNPKGVAVPHQAIVRLVRETNYVQITPDDCIAQASNANFDAATFEIWGALLNGAKMVGITKEVMLSPEQLYQQLKKDKITILFITTALFNQLVSFRADIFASLKTILFGGEAVNPSWVQAVLKNKPPARLLHVYGPTESTTFATWYLIEEVPEGATNIPIGRPLSNTTLYVLDSHLQPVPIGVPGELYIGGYGLARGYLNRPELTEQKFIPNPFSKIPSRLYKTGDLVRYLTDGSIEFITRIDNQVKIRGFPIELEEIKAILEQHSIVKEAVAIARTDSDGNKQLVAYIVPQYSQNELLADLRNFLQAQLPEYMIPSAFLLLDAFPLTVNGKIDTRSLPEPNANHAIRKTSENPQTEIEQKIAEVWQEILKLNSVGRDDNFFEVGGHSLLLIQVNQKLKAVLNAELSMLEMFQYPTIRALGERLGKTKPESSPTTKDDKGRRPERQNLLQQQRKARQQKRKS
ncbi:amino acid adenylation domain-containing protein [Microseira sp. BLCC-F43]|jgi:amino acid adenylation domain-containing protein|uniref:amino acid adenylation domain-containing protein n=1 Tax=Microseira sp. BLCC-F43 TaxID=3153602 RepID=UPI0035BA0C59